MINNILKPVGLFATPQDMESLQDYLSNFNGSEGTVAQTAAWMTWNLASKLLGEVIEAEKNSEYEASRNKLVSQAADEAPNEAEEIEMARRADLAKRTEHNDRYFINDGTTSFEVTKEIYDTVDGEDFDGTGNKEYVTKHTVFEHGVNQTCHFKDNDEFDHSDYILTLNK